MADETVHVVFAVLIGLVLGSVLPADLLARTRGIDIRSVGDRNPGTVNAFRTLGKTAGFVTGIYDTSVGVVSLQIALLLGVPGGWPYVVGIMAVVGHRFPVFGGFRGGGEGMAASAGLLVYGIGVAIARGELSFVDLGVLVLILGIAFLLARSDVIAALIILPIVVARVLIAHADWQFQAFMTVLAAHIWITQVVILRASPPVRVFRWRWLRGQPRD